MPNEEFHRDSAVQEIESGHKTAVIQFEAVLEHAEEIFLDDIYDTNGDCIRAEAEFRFACHGTPLFQAIVPRGSSPQIAARILRKFADALDGRQGYDIINMSWEEGSPDIARFDANGNADIYNYLERFDGRQDESRGDEEVDDDTA